MKLFYVIRVYDKKVRSTLNVTTPSQYKEHFFDTEDERQKCWEKIQDKPGIKEQYILERS